MRKALIAAAVATALFAVGAFAASLSVQSEDVASGSNAVSACATSVDVDFDDPVLGTDGTWTVDGATVAFLGGTGDGCSEHDARLAVDSGAGYVEVGSETAVSATNDAVFSFTAIDVANIVGASVVVDGATLTADL
jgi:hypothetical protein